MTARQLATHPVHLGRGATVQPQPAFTGMDWYAGYVERTKADGAEGRLVSQHSFHENWDSWEMHPAGEELVLCLAGQMVLHQEGPDGATATITLEPGDYAINAPGVWHTADLVDGPATALFITAGMGTQHRPR